MLLPLILILATIRFSVSIEYKEVGIEADTDTLEYVHTVWRHGDRTPAELLNPDDLKKWPEGLGELTEEGAAQQYRLGQWLRKRYGSWLGEFNRNSVALSDSNKNQ
ncbi:hypothetical protein CAEBREN_32618 [Caenorhabditis brenneri]|uniref:Uncharacterized protein n=1 Tax=Caenorhabditis brenneri TaxID=135651 RepID=G0NGS3_CAEBE|nr:hypothetical protein CAEBREN_32618 [Caenorhabditis brenneri]